MSVQPKNVDQHYFDLQRRTEDEIKRRLYVWGAFIAGYAPIGDYGVEFRSRHPELVEIVKRELQIEHKVRSNEGHSYFIRIEKAPQLRSALEQIGMCADKYQRKFPDVPSQYLSSLHRGFIEQRAVVYESSRGTARISIAFSQLLLESLNRALASHAGIKRGSPTRNVIDYSIADSVKIHSFIYSDWDFIRQYGLYVPAVKQMMEINVNRTVPVYLRTREAIARIGKAKKYLLRGYTATEAGEKVGYRHVSNFTQAFKNATDQTTSEFLALNNAKVRAKAKRAKKKQLATSRAPIRLTVNVYGSPPRLGRREYLCR